MRAVFYVCACFLLSGFTFNSLLPFQKRGSRSWNCLYLLLRGQLNTS